MRNQGIYIFQETRISIQDVIGDVYDEMSGKKVKTKDFFEFQPIKTLKLVSTTANSAKSVVTCLFSHLGNKNRQ